MDGRINRRKFMFGAGSTLLSASKTEAATSKTEKDMPNVSISRFEMSDEYLKQAVEDTAASLAKGISSIQGRKVNPRDSGFMYHHDLLRHYAEGFKLPSGLSDEQIAATMQRRFAERIKIFPIFNDDVEGLEKNCAGNLQMLGGSMEKDENAAFIYLSKDRSFQRLYLVKKDDVSILKLLESYPISTSRAEPQVPRRGYGASITPLGLFTVPRDGIRAAFPGEVTRSERPDITRYYFVPIKIDGKIRYFVKDPNKTASDEIVTLTGDTHLLWSPEIDGRGVKIHDTTELDKIGKPVSSGCIRTPSVRRFTEMTRNNKHPTKVFVHWSGAPSPDDGGFGMIFGGGPLKERPRKKR